MKKLSVLALILIFAAGAAITGCGDTEPTPVKNDDTTTQVTITNEFKIGFDTYKIETIDLSTYGYYSSTEDKTYIFVEGSDATLGDADFVIWFDGNATGTFKTVDGTAHFACGTGEKGTIYREEFTSDGGTVTVNVTEYGAVDGQIKGTFSGTVMKSLNSFNVSNGKFDVTRDDDQ